jgi:diaminopimelate epimerase
MTLAFTKMHGIGNDFVVLDRRRQTQPPSAAMIRAMAERHTGIGFDQLLTIEAARHTDSAFAYGIWNADGSAAGQCGNGVRCVAAWLHRAGALQSDALIQLDSPSGPVRVRVQADGHVAVDMGEPVFGPARIPFAAATEADRYTLDVDGTGVSVGVVSMGNPHALVEADALDEETVARLGPAITTHPRFAEGCNTGFARLRADGGIDLRVHERGSGWTRACGTGACAAAAVLRRRGRVEERTIVHLPGGALTIDWPGPGHALWMTGPAVFVFDGQWLGITS